MSISISPAITTTPALDSLFPIYWEDLTDEEKQQGVTLSLSASNEPANGTPITVTLTPTSDWYAYNYDDGTAGEKGQPISFTGEYFSGFFRGLMCLVANEPPSGQSMPDELLKCNLKIQF